MNFEIIIWIIVILILYLLPIPFLVNLCKKYQKPFLISFTLLVVTHGILKFLTFLTLYILINNFKIYSSYELVYLFYAVRIPGIIITTYLMSVFMLQLADIKLIKMTKIIVLLIAVLMIGLGYYSVNEMSKTSRW